ncbi:MAG TPA: hypothetical protein DDZ56_08840 [Cytophagales bacterium]|nr:hypothetical protein [Cytophagales bacterium]
MCHEKVVLDAGFALGTWRTRRANIYVSSISNNSDGIRLSTRKMVYAYQRILAGRGLCHESRAQQQDQADGFHL